MTQLSLTVRSSEAEDLTVTGEFVVRCKCPKCLKSLRRSASTYLYKGAPTEQSISITCGHCGHTFALYICQTAFVPGDASDNSEESV